MAMSNLVKGLLVLGAAGAAYAVYQAVQPKTTSSVPAGEPTQYTVAQGQGSQTVSMHVGDMLTAPAQTAGPTVTGTSVFGGNEANIANGGTLTAATTGTESMSWPDGTSVTVTVS